MSISESLKPQVDPAMEHRPQLSLHGRSPCFQRNYHQSVTRTHSGKSILPHQAPGWRRHHCRLGLFKKLKICFQRPLLQMKRNLVGKSAPQMARVRCKTAWVLHLMAGKEEKQSSLTGPACLPRIPLCQNSRCVRGRLSITFSALCSEIFEVSLMAKTFS